jgi:GTPase SAR1 family protein
VEVLDTSGQDEYKEVTRSKLREIEVFVIVIDLTREDALNCFESHLQYIKENWDSKRLSKAILVGNKADYQQIKTLTLGQE